MFSIAVRAAEWRPTSYASFKTCPAVGVGQQIRDYNSAGDTGSTLTWKSNKRKINLELEEHPTQPNAVVTS